jgi:large subunit ribosomal protein L4
MDITIRSLDGTEDGTVTLSDAIFGLEPRGDILQRIVRWQLSKRQAGTHKAQTRGEVSMTTAKMYKQKGTGRARHGAKSAPQFRGGGKAHGPRPRSHAHDLTKKVRVLGLKLALSAKAQSQDLMIISDAKAAEAKTKTLKSQLGTLGLSNVLIISGEAVDGNFALSARNIPNVDVLPVAGVNVYDILRRQKLVLTKAAVEALEARLA